MTEQGGAEFAGPENENLVVAEVAQEGQNQEAEKQPQEVQPYCKQPLHYFSQ